MTEPLRHIPIAVNSELGDDGRLLVELELLGQSAFSLVYERAEAEALVELLKLALEREDVEPTRRARRRRRRRRAAS